MDLNPTDIIIHILNILVLFIVLKLLVYKPVRKFMRARAEGVEADIAAAQTSAKEAEALKTQYEQQLAGAKEQALEIVDEDMRKAQDEAKQIVGDARRQAEQLLETAQAQIAADKVQAMEEMREDVVDIASQMASELLQREISAEDNRDLADKFFVRLGDGDRAEQ